MTACTSRKCRGMRCHFCAQSARLVVIHPSCSAGAELGCVISPAKVVFVIVVAIDSWLHDLAGQAASGNQHPCAQKCVQVAGRRLARAQLFCKDPSTKPCLAVMCIVKEPLRMLTRAFLRCAAPRAPTRHPRFRHRPSGLRRVCVLNEPSADGLLADSQRFSMGLEVWEQRFVAGSPNMLCLFRCTRRVFCRT